MTNYLKFTTKDGDDFLVEVDTILPSISTEEDEEVKASVVSKVSEKVAKHTITTVQNTFDDALDVVKANAIAFISKIRELPDQEQPAEMEMSFTLKAADELGGKLVLAKKQAEANYTITLTWRK